PNSRRSWRRAARLSSWFTLCWRAAALTRGGAWGFAQSGPCPERACPRACPEGRRAAAGSKRDSTSSARGCCAGQEKALRVQPGSILGSTVLSRHSLLHCRNGRLSRREQDDTLVSSTGGGRKTRGGCFMAHADIILPIEPARELPVVQSIGVRDLRDAL